MRLLDRYLLRELLVPLAYCLGGFLIFWISFDLFSTLGEFQNRKLKALDVAEYYVVKTPEMLSIVLPVALLLGLLYALTNHARSNELTAMRAAGVSLWRLSLPYWAVGFLLSLALLAINELWVPKSAERIERILNRYDQQAQTGQDWTSNLYFRNEPEQRYWRAKLYHPKTQVLKDLNVQWHFPNGSWRDIYAATGFWTNGAWNFFNVQEWTYKTPNDALPSLVTNAISHFSFSETPALIKSEIKINNLSGKQAAKRPQLSIQEIQDYFKLHPNLSGAKASMLETQLHGRIALPWRCLIVVLIAIPFGAPSGRRNVFVGVAASIFICFGYFIFFQVGLHLGVGGTVPGWLAGWLPNMLFGATGIFLTAKVR